MNSQISSTRGSLPGSGYFSTLRGFSRESIMTPYWPPLKNIAFANVACMPVSLASSPGSSTPFTRAVRQSISCRQAKSGSSARMRAAVRSTSSLWSIPSQCMTL